VSLSNLLNLDLSSLSNFDSLNVGGYTLDQSSLSNLFNIDFSNLDLSGLSNFGSLTVGGYTLDQSSLSNLFNIDFSTVDLSGLSNFGSLTVGGYTLDQSSLSNLFNIDFSNLDLSGFSNFESIVIGGYTLDGITLSNLLDHISSPPRVIDLEFDPNGPYQYTENIYANYIETNYLKVNKKLIIDAVSATNTIGDSGQFSNLYVSGTIETPMISIDSNIITSSIAQELVTHTFESEVTFNADIIVDNTVTLSNNANDSFWKMYNNTVNSNTSDLVFVSNQGTATVFSETFTEGLLNFTSKHTVSTLIDLREENITDDLIGKIVISTGQYKDLDNSDIIRIDEATPIVALSTQEKDSRIFGVVAGFEQPGTDKREFKIGTIIFTKAKEKQDIKLVVNGSGEGALLVCDYFGPIKNGDLLCSSPIPGLACKQDDNIIRSYTVAKATADCDFVDHYPKSKYGLKSEKLNDKTYQKCLIGVIYMC
jgi:hypothetical protein